VAIPPHIVNVFSLRAAGGVLVIAVEPGSPAARAGLRERDVIVELGGQALASIEDLQKLLTDERIGAPIDLVVVRGSERLTLRPVPIEYGNGSG
jgi:S1-C subfamily serine protease